MNRKILFTSLLMQSLIFIFSIAFGGCDSKPASTVAKDDSLEAKKVVIEPAKEPVLDTADYNKRMLGLANGDTTGLWPVKGVYPNYGALLPFKRIVSFYGNLYSKQMGILGELPEAQMIAKLQGEIKKWELADTSTPVIPALHYIAVVAHSGPGNEGKYILRMPHAQIDTILRMAATINAQVFIDIQVGLSTLQRELPLLEEYLKKPNVHLGIDPEFSMKTGKRPGTVVGSYNAADINFAANYLAGLVRKNNLTPKILVVHRFTRNGVKNYKDIKLLPEVQVVMDMDGWGKMDSKLTTYYKFIQPEPVQFTGFKIFYKNDTKKVHALKEMQPEDVLKLKPRPIYIQYQ